MGLANNLGGTVREMAAEETFKRLKPHLAEFGITRVADITGLDTIGIPVLTVVRPLARSLSVSQGKGVTRDLAAVSGVMESIEMFHAEQRRPPPTIRKSFRLQAQFVLHLTTSSDDPFRRGSLRK